MKQVAWLASIVAVFFGVYQVTPSAVLATLFAVAWGLAIGKWLGATTRVGKSRDDRVVEGDYAVSPLDINATPAARGFARLRSRE